MSGHDQSPRHEDNSNTTNQDSTNSPSLPKSKHNWARSSQEYRQRRGAEPESGPERYHSAEDREFRQWVTAMSPSRSRIPTVPAEPVIENTEMTRLLVAVDRIRPLEIGAKYVSAGEWSRFKTALVLLPGIAVTILVAYLMHFSTCRVPAMWNLVPSLVGLFLVFRLSPMRNEGVMVTLCILFGVSGWLALNGFDYWQFRQDSIADLRVYRPRFSDDELNNLLDQRLKDETGYGGVVGYIKFQSQGEFDMDDNAMFSVVKSEGSAWWLFRLGDLLFGGVGAGIAAIAMLGNQPYCAMHHRNMKEDKPYLRMRIEDAREFTRRLIGVDDEVAQTIHSKLEQRRTALYLYLEYCPRCHNAYVAWTGKGLKEPLAVAYLAGTDTDILLAAATPVKDVFDRRQEDVQKQKKTMVDELMRAKSVTDVPSDQAILARIQQPVCGQPSIDELARLFKFTRKDLEVNQRGKSRIRFQRDDAGVIDFLFALVVLVLGLVFFGFATVMVPILIYQTFLGMHEILTTLVMSAGALFWGWYVGARLMLWGLFKSFFYPGGLQRVRAYDGYLGSGMMHSERSYIRVGPRYFEVQRSAYKKLPARLPGKYRVYFKGDNDENAGALLSIEPWNDEFLAG